MPNNILTPEIIAREALMVLQNNLIMANLVHRDYDSEFVAGVGDTITIRKPAKFVAHNFTGNIVVQDAVEGKESVKLDHFRDVSFKVTSKELTLDIKNFSEQFLQPALMAIAQSIDEDILNVVAGVNNAVTATANPTNLKDIADISKMLDINKAPMSMRRLVLNPEHKYRYALTDNLSKVSYAGTGDTLRNAELGKVYSLDTYMDQNAPYSFATTPGTMTACKVTGNVNEKKLQITDAKAATGTLKIGDGLIIDGRMYRITKDATAASGAAADVEIDMPLHIQIDEATDAYVVTKHHSLAFHRNAIALVTRTLALPMGNKQAAVVQDNGLGVRVVYDYDTNTKTDYVSLDVLYGIKLLYPELAVKLVG